MDAFEEFDTKSFVSRLLGKGDVKGLAKKLEEAMPEEKQMEFMEQLQKGTMTLRFFRGFLEQVGSMGPLSSVLHPLSFAAGHLIGIQYILCSVGSDCLDCCA
jgi:signal recognition particle subunit SRP54